MPVHGCGQLLECLHAVVGANLRLRLNEPLAAGLRQLGRQDGAHLVEIGVGIPDGQLPHLREFDHRPPVAADRGEYDPGAALTADAILTCGYDKARGQPLDVPFPRPRVGLVEVVDVEHQAPLG
jgi:hypothetical protein